MEVKRSTGYKRSTRNLLISVYVQIYFFVISYYTRWAFLTDLSFEILPFQPWASEVSLAEVDASLASETAGDQEATL